jgi:putative PIN family toxin of toxin-antitoxin system
LAVEKAIAQATILASLETLHELEDVLLRARFERYQAIAVRRKFLETIEPYFEPISVRTRISICRHPKDDKFLELAMDGRADLIITGDNDLLVLSSFEGIPIITPMQYLGLD